MSEVLPDVSQRAFGLQPHRSQSIADPSMISVTHPFLFFSDRFQGFSQVNETNLKF